MPFSTPLLAADASSDWIVELTREKGGGFRELVLRDATIALGGKRVAETIARLDLRNPGNLAAARPFLDAPIPWTVPGGSTKQAVLDRIASHGAVERLTSTVEDRSRGVSASIRFGVKLSLGGRRSRSCGGSWRPRRSSAAGWWDSGSTVCPGRRRHDRARRRPRTRLARPDASRDLSPRAARPRSRRGVQHGG